MDRPAPACHPLEGQACTSRGRPTRRRHLREPLVMRLVTGWDGRSPYSPRSLGGEWTPRDGSLCRLLRRRYYLCLKRRNTSCAAAPPSSASPEGHNQPPPSRRLRISLCRSHTGGTGRAVSAEGVFYLHVGDRNKAGNVPRSKYISISSRRIDSKRKADKDGCPLERACLRPQKKTGG